MCGIIAIIKKEDEVFSKEKLFAMLEPLKSRGPDENGSLEISNCILGQTRLSIIDISQGHQPMQDALTKVAISFNGEIYNYKELKLELEEKGYLFNTNSDTEVILKSYLEFGTDCLSHFDGMFAFTIWDKRKETLFLARDRFGKKPIYYTHDQRGNFLVASEIKALFASGEVMGEIDPTAIADYLTLMYIPPNKTVYKNIHTLEPGEFALYNNGTLKKEKYWTLRRSQLEISREEAKEKVKTLLSDSVKKRMVADVEIGSFLSGGVDSTLVTLNARKFNKSPIKTFALGYGDYRNELPFAKEASKKIGSDHYTLQASEDNFDSLLEAISYFDEPHADSSDFPQSLLSKFASDKVKVALSGDGADEIFMGYGWYQKHWHLSFRKHTFQKLFLNPFQGYLRNISIFNKMEIKKIWKGKSPTFMTFLNKKAFRGLSSLEKINLFDLSIYLPGQLLSKIDRMSMMHSLEVRSPFLDHHLVEFVYNLPIEYKMNKIENKIILKEILSETMPKEFVYRRKQGFGAPVLEWLQNPKLEKIIKGKFEADALIYSFLKKDEVTELISDFYNKGKKEGFYKMWVLLCLELWLESHKKYIKI